MEKQKSQINIDEVIDRLCINNKEIVDNIFSVYYDLIKQEEERRSELDSKAYNLIGILGVCITLIFGFGGVLIEKIKEPFWLLIMVILYLGTVMFGVISLMFALNAVKARSDFRSIDDEDIFQKEMVQSDIVTYKRYLIAHFWQIYNNNFRINEGKGISLKSAFRMFSIVVIFLLLIVFVIGKYILLRGGR